MARTRIKICGVRDADTARAAADAGADAIGLIFVEGSPRFVTIEQAERIIKALPAFVEPIAVFVDANVEQVWSICEALGVRTVQLHGGETRTYIEQLIDLRVLKSVSFEPDDLDLQLGPWRNVTTNVAGLVWDTPPATDGDLTGGSGKAFDWNAMAKLSSNGTLSGLPPTILAGGLTAGNVADAIRTVRPFGVDVSSGVEASRGVKDAKRIRQFCDAVRGAH